MYEPASPDTDPRIEEFILAVNRRMTPAEKLSAIGRLWRLQVQLAEAGLRGRYPGAGLEEMQKRLCAILHGREVSLRFFGWDPDREGY